MWEESLLVVMWEDSLLGRVAEVLPHPRSVGVTTGAVRSARLQPHEQISHDVNVLELPGRIWPRGGSAYRVSVGLRLGELEPQRQGHQHQNYRGLYYSSHHHDSKLQEAQAARLAYVAREQEHCARVEMRFAVLMMGILCFHKRAVHHSDDRVTAMVLIIQNVLIIGGGSLSQLILQKLQ